MLALLGITAAAAAVLLKIISVILKISITVIVVILIIKFCKRRYVENHLDHIISMEIIDLKKPSKKKLVLKFSKDTSVTLTMKVTEPLYEKLDKMY